MFVLLSKILDLTVAPLSWALALGVAALWLARRRPAQARAAALLALAIVTVFALPPVPVALFAALERRAADTFHPDPPYDVVIVLGGVAKDAVQRPDEPVALGPAADRIVRAMELLQAGQAREVLLSGGNVFPVAGEPPESERLARFLRAHGIAPERIFLEPRSRNTRENALESAALVAAHPEWRRILLVTSAWHAPRAMGCFRAAGLAPDLLTVDHRGRPPLHVEWAPRAKALSDSTDVLRELAGGVVYRLLGYAR